MIDVEAVRNLLDPHTMPSRLGELIPKAIDELATFGVFTIPPSATRVGFPHTLHLSDFAANA